MLALRLLSEGGGGPSTELLWIVYTGIMFFFLVIAVGWMSSGRKQNQNEAQSEADKHVVKKDVESKSGKKK